jgi:hypothetical protein
MHHGDLGELQSALFRKRESFCRYAEPRTDRAVKAINTVGHLANRGSYDFSDQEAKQIVKALKNAVALVEAKFNQAFGRGGGKFRL